MKAALSPVRIPVILIFLGLMAESCLPRGNGPATVRIDCSRQLDTDLPLGGYFNNSLRKAPPPELPAMVEKQFGRPKITRCWLTLDDMWDYRTGEYRYNFQIGKDYYPGDTIKNTYKSKNPMGLELKSEILFEDYITSFSRHSDQLMLNVRRYETEVLKGILTIEQWEEVLGNALAHYKALCPNLVYIEVLNECGEPHFGGVEDEEYYMFFKAAYLAVNAVNSSLQPEQPLQVGGPSYHYKHDINQFLSDYAADEDPDKRFDFITYHEYGAGDRPARFARHQDEVKATLGAHGLDQDLPQFITEMGYVGRTTENWKDNYKQACFVTSAIFHARNSDRVTIMPWVLYHTYRLTSHVMYTDELELTPFGHAMKMLTLHGGTEVYAGSDSLTADGNGVGVLASMDGGRLVVQLWNYSEQPFAGNVLIKSLPAPLADREVAVMEYRIDTTHNNAFSDDPDQTGTSYETGEWTTGEDLVIVADMKPMSLVAWIIEPKSN